MSISSKIRQLAGQTMLYGLGNMLPRLLNFLLIRPQITAFNDPEKFGVLTNILSFTALLNIVYSFGMETAFFRFASKPGADAKRVFNIAQTVVTGLSLLLTVLLFLSTDFLTDLMEVPQKSLIVYMIFILLVDNLTIIPFARLRLENKALLFALYKIINVLVLVGLNLYFLYIIYDPAVGAGYVLIANLIANCFYLFFFAKDLFRWRPVFDKELSYAMFSYAYPVMLTGLAAMMNEFFSRGLLTKLLPPGFYPGRTSQYALGVFGACYKFSVLMNLGIQAFRMGAEPFFFSQAKEKNSPRLFALINHYFIIAGCVLMLAVALNTDLLCLLFIPQKEYWEGLSIVPPLLLGYLFLGVYYNFTVWFKLTDKTYFGTYITVGGAVLTVVLNYLFIPLWGYSGSSWATPIVYGAMMAACYWLGQKYYPIPYFVFSGMVYITLSFLLIYIVKTIPFSNAVCSASFSVAVILLFAATAWMVERKRGLQSQVLK